METPDGELLERFSSQQSQAAFAELVRRHLDLVYHTALRRVGGDRHLAEDVSQRVFADLARKAPTLAGRATVAGWLYISTRFAATQVVRTEQRRKFHEQEAYAMNEANHPTTPDWNQLTPVIDDVLEELSEGERDAILLRYFEHLPLASVGAKLSVSPDAARMRVDRALEKLRTLLTKRGVASTSAALAGAFTSQAQLTAPAGLAAAVAAQIFAPAGMISTAVVVAGKGVPLTLGKLAAIGVLGVAGAIGLGLTVEAWLHPNPQSVVKLEPVGRTAGGEAAVSGADTTLEAAVRVVEGERAKTPEAIVALAPPDGTTGLFRVERLDRLVGLSEAQKEAAAVIFLRENAALETFVSIEERMEKGVSIRQTSRGDIRALLTPAQQKIYDTSPQRLGGAALQDPAMNAARVDKLVDLTEEQTSQVAALYVKQLDALQALSAEERSDGRGAAITGATKREVRALLTPEQRAKFDANPVSAEGLEARAAAKRCLESSAALQARVGAVERLTFGTAAVMTARNGDEIRAMRGNYLYEVKGNRGSESVRIYWVKPSGSEPVTVSKLETSKGELIEAR